MLSLHSSRLGAKYATHMPMTVAVKNVAVLEGE
jgi:hypothetical protein